MFRESASDREDEIERTWCPYCEETSGGVHLVATELPGDGGAFIENDFVSFALVRFRAFEIDEEDLLRILSSIEDDVPKTKVLMRETSVVDSHKYLNEPGSAQR